MKAEPHITATVIFHREAAFALAAIGSFSDLVNIARASGQSRFASSLLRRPPASSLRALLLNRVTIHEAVLASFENVGYELVCAATKRRLRFGRSSAPLA